MPRSYSVRLAALTTGADSKWIDNLLSRHQLPGVSRERRGVERRIDDEGLIAIELIRILNLELGVSMAAAISITAAMMVPHAAGHYETPSGLALHVPMSELEQRLLARLGDALEFVARVPRGRPRLAPDPTDS
jgi:hypothetical protein